MAKRIHDDDLKDIAGGRPLSALDRHDLAERLFSRIRLNAGSRGGVGNTGIDTEDSGSGPQEWGA